MRQGAVLRSDAEPAAARFADRRAGPTLPSSEPDSPPLLTVKDLDVCFPTRHGWVQAVDQVSLTIHPGETLGIVGESGCGKSVTCLGIMRLLPRTAAVRGEATFAGRDLMSLSERELDRVRGREIAMVFQDPMASLNPLRTVGSQIADKLVVHDGLGRSAALKQAERQLDLVRVPAARSRLGDYPHQLSGGLCQRVMIGMALACGPKLLIADEPTTALDVTIQAQLLRLLRELQREFGLALVLVTHDLGVVTQMADQLAVMYAGRIVEDTPLELALGSPRHPYTRGLVQASPRLDTPPGRLSAIAGTVPSLTNLPPGCAFEPRCSRTTPHCSSQRPPLRPLASDVSAACINPHDGPLDP